MILPLPVIAAKLALEVRMYGHCRGKLHKPLKDGKPPLCECRHCVTLRNYDAHIAATAIIQTPSGAAQQVLDSLREAGE